MGTYIVPLLPTYPRLPAAVQENEPALILQKERLECDFHYGFQPIRLLPEDFRLAKIFA